ncbi:ABC transporter permease [Bradyrhizobium sp. CCGUVB1N3]|uniref:ABC transporter permease n=1 Tax=Bradyrhizobium sp. CCGUVB1N3 TaxID=2949629 RepID=UPI0020B26880|nr:ABC transporter permease [Bradyrhizobium sp. CCGUVB1N3]MCP3474092.1 ABC transporter permease [Bradyrhizobium sp. CCGUVB1N3]
MSATPTDQASSLRRRIRGYALASPSLLLILALLAVPLVQMVDASFRRQDFGLLLPGFTLENYRAILSSASSLELFAKTGFAAFLVTALCALLGFPVALLIASAQPRQKPFLYFLVAAPLLVNTVVRSYGWLLMLGNQGVVNMVLKAAGLIDKPIALSGNMTGMVIAATQVFLPFMILSLVASLEAINPHLLESAETLGASGLRRFRDITLPLAMPGLIAGSALVFSLMLGAIITPLMLGGSAIRYLSIAIYTDAMVLFDLPHATAFSVILLAVVIGLYIVQSRYIRSYKDR